MNISGQQHWDKIYSTKGEDEVSWFQYYPKTSMEFVELFNLPLDANIIDIGGGDSHFVDALIDKGYQNIWVLDISPKAIERAKQRLGETRNFEYDPAGNLVTIKPAGSYGGYEFRYDYTQLDSGMATLHYLSPATKTLEFMGLLKFEYHHKLVSVIRYESSGYPSLAWGYFNTEKNPRGNVTVYSTDNSKWFTAWDCSGINQLSSKNPTQEEFMKMVR